jgi:hypothetical protein
VLGEDELAVDEDVELAGFSRFDRGVEAGFSLDGGRETRSPGFVVSGVAVLDDDALAHGGTMAKNGPRGKGTGGIALGTQRSASHPAIVLSSRAGRAAAR